MTIDIRDGLLQIFNVDHGACALLTMPSPLGVKRVLIDCGHATDMDGKPWFPGEHLGRPGVSHIDLLICTNYDEDHASGVPSLLRNKVSVGTILCTPTVPPEVIERLKSEDGMGNGIRLLANSLAARNVLIAAHHGRDYTLSRSQRTARISTKFGREGLTSMTRCPSR